MANRYWVGGTGNWNSTAGTKWSATSGTPGGASVPTEDDDVYFDAASGSGVVTITETASAANFNTTGFTGTIAGTSTLRVDQNLTLSSGVTFTHSGTISMTDNTGTATIRTAGKTIGSLTLGGASSSATFSLQDALTMTGTLTLTGGTFTTNNFNVTAASLSSSNTNTRTINLGSSTLTLTGASAVDFFSSTGLTVNAGTSSINMSNASANFNGGSKTFYNISFTSTSASTLIITGTNVFNNATVTGRTSSGIANVSISGNQTINGTFTLSAGTNATMRTFVRSDTLGTTRTLTCAAFSGTDADFRDITVTGVAAPISGTRLGDCKGNSGITFPAGVTRYWNLATGGNWSATGWATTSGGATSVANFPLAQDTAIFEATGLNSGSTITIDNNYNIGTINMSDRTGNTMTLTVSTSPVIYGNWINGTGVTPSGIGTITFSGRNTQTITSAGRTFTQSFTINSPSGTVQLLDAFITSRSASTAFNVTNGTLDLNSYAATLSGASSTFRIDNAINSKTLAFNSGTLVIAGTGGWSAASPLTITGAGTISLTAPTAKIFAGGGIQTYPTLNQGGLGAITVTGSNKFANITNTDTGSVLFTGGTINSFDAFNLSGTSGNLIQLSSSSITQATLVKSSAWNMGANSTDEGNNTGLSFTSGGGIDYLRVSYINGVNSAPSTGNFFMLF